MPGLARKVIICAAVDGLVLQPLVSKKEQQRPPNPIKIKYGDATISHISRDSAPDYNKPNTSFEAFGIIGLISVFSYNYLVSITRRQQVAQIRGLPIYLVTEVALTPCTSQKDASEAVAKTAQALSTREIEDSDDDDGATDDEAPTASGSSDEVGDVASDIEGDDKWSTEVSPNMTARSSIAEDVMNRRGSYGRFASRWFSRSGWATDQKRTMGLSAEQTEQALADSGSEAGGNKSSASKSVPKKFPLPVGAVGNEAALSLLPKLLRTAQIFFGSSRTFYYSYDYDITRSLANPKVPATSLVPLYNHADPNFFWNRNIIQPFIDSGVDTLALPLMQGFVGQRTFTVDSHVPQVDDGAKDSMEMDNLTSDDKGPSERVSLDRRSTQKKFDITVISRRSIKRAGLRYLRRGIDEDGNVANSVETEQVLSPAVDADTPLDSDDKSTKVYSFVQIRGSFPLFFTQSPYSLKPAPVLRHSPEANFAALKKHFDGLRKKYGELQIVNLVEKHGVESRLGELYDENIKRLNELEEKESPQSSDGQKPEKVSYEWFDFHHVCRGMKFENVSFLLGILGPKLEALGSTVADVDAQGVHQVTERQKGVLRTNCMDCLDRTNVCQSSFAKYMLDVQLKEQGFDMALQSDQENSWFNTLWADNGDAISKQYASTGAMKGDYTRTRKRNYRGALTDAGLSLTRLFNGMFNDFFLQTTIDFLLGNVTSLVFEEFEANMMTKDPAVSMQKMREQAIELSQKRVVADESEEFMGGWTLLTPHTPDTVRSGGNPLEEAVLLLTDKALYLVRFDWNLDKVSSFERVDLSHVTKIRFGTYITSTISPAQVDEMRNVGLVVEYKPGSTDVTRVNTRSLSSSMSAASSKKRVEAAEKAEDADDESKEKGKAEGESSSKSVPASAAAAAASGIAGFLGRSRPSVSSVPAALVPPRKIALKALYSQTSAADPKAKAKKAIGGAGEDAEPEAITRLSEIQQVVVIAAEIERLAIQAQPKLQDKKKKSEDGDVGLIEKGDIISLADARKNTGLLEQLGHSIKKMVWA